MSGSGGAGLTIQTTAPPIALAPAADRKTLGVLAQMVVGWEAAC